MSEEGVFSRIKRIFGEYVSAKKLAKMAREMAMGASTHNVLIGVVRPAGLVGDHH
ncbi:MAG: hypothetical protein QW429_03360 [Thermoprotei archaeon]